MNTLAVAVLFVAVAYASASGIDAEYSIKGDLEGALGGQWIPDVPVAAGHGAIGLGAAGLGLGAAGLGYGAPALGLAAPALGLGVPAWGLGAGIGLGAHGVSRGSLEGALGGQWIPDTHGHGK
ncbi:uncharacterized protein [Leptinotarsa decemlineata]|uniref:Putative glycine-rich protein n=1 Tax=Leptinotarsa decemlineata TaxID=7539 RepID=A5H0L9_LEPDE|nr:elastin-like [Leptinotarsa decemlineata]ABF60887.1 putative glycine-rich protein [Leptinotarsa decemlineata]